MFHQKERGSKMKNKIILPLIILLTIAVSFFIYRSSLPIKFVSFGYNSMVDGHYFIFNNISNSSKLKIESNGILYKLRSDSIVIDEVEPNLSEEDMHIIFYDFDKKEYHYGIDSLKYFNIHNYTDTNLANDVNLISFYIGKNEESIKIHNLIRDSIINENSHLNN
jgi:hypothetical protein